MLRDMTIGQYYPTGSPIHALDARVKLLATFVYIISLFLVKGFIPYAVIILLLACVIAASKVPPSFMFKGVKGILFIIIFTVFINIFTEKSGRPVIGSGWFTITTGGLALASLMCIRIILLIVGSSVMTLTTTPIQLTDALEYILKPFAKIGVPAHEIAMMMTIALRFIPTLLDETDKIMKAQQARGADFETGGLIKRARSLVPILVPLFISAFRRADELAMAMDARCYNGGQNRTRMNEMHMQGIDYAAIAALSLYIAIVIAMRIYL